MTRAEYNLTRLRSLLRQAIATLPQPYQAMGEQYLAGRIPWTAFRVRSRNAFLDRLRLALREDENELRSILDALNSTQNTERR